MLLELCNEKRSCQHKAFPAEERKEVIIVCARMELSGRRTIKDVSRGEYFYTLKWQCV